MRLRNINFGRVLGASGVQGFFGEGYWYHKYGRPFGLDFTGSTFVAKTTTLNARKGNMPLKPDYTPSERFPRCIKVKPAKGIALNAVGLSGPGAGQLFNTGNWQENEKPFFISFMSTEDTKEKRLLELHQFCFLLRSRMAKCRARFGLQQNFSCPNVGLDVAKLSDEVLESLDITARLQIPVVPKFNVLFPVEVARIVSEHPACEAICVSNTVPWGKLNEFIDWAGLFGTDHSPLAHFGGGGLSGKPLLPLLLRWLDEAKKLGVSKPINAGGGILSKDDAHAVFSAGASSISLGSIAFLRPWRVKGIIEEFS